MTGPSHPEMRGVHVVDVVPAGPADTAGLQPGDFLLSLNGKELRSPQQLPELVAQMRAGDDVELTVWRNGGTFNTTATLDEQPERQTQRRDYRREPKSGEAWMGVLLNEQPIQNPDVQGAVITHVYPGGPASQAGIRDGDRIVAVNGNEIQSADQLVEQIRQHAPGDELTFEVVRSGNEEPQTVRVRAGNREDFFPTGPGPAIQHNPIFDLPEHVMRLEHERRMAEHDERIEGLLLEVLHELRDLRHDVEALKGEGEGSGDSARAQQRAVSDQPLSGSRNQTIE